MDKPKPCTHQRHWCLMVREDLDNQITYYRVDKAEKSGATSKTPTCWCRDCGAISVAGRPWRLPNRRRVKGR